jgi:hypothetical protein
MTEHTVATTARSSPRWVLLGVGAFGAGVASAVLVSGLLSARLPPAFDTEVIAVNATSPVVCVRSADMADDDGVCGWVATTQERALREGDSVRVRFHPEEIQGLGVLEILDPDGN